MKLFFSGRPMDELGPLRDLRSPLSTSAIKQLVLERSAVPALWGQLRSILAEVLVVGVAGAAVFRLAAPMARQGVPLGAYQVANPFIATHVSDRTNGSDKTDGKKGESKGLFSPRSSQPGIAKDIPIALVNAVASSEAPLILHTSSFNPQPSFFILQPSSFNLHPSSLRQAQGRLFNLHPSPIWFASASGGAIFSHLRIESERAEIGYQDGWKTVALSYIDGEGNRDLRDVIVHHPGLTAPSTTPLVSKESDQEFSLLLGATAQMGPFKLRAMAGPAYHSSSATYYSLSTGTTGAPVSFQGIGAAAEISTLYALDSSFELGVAGTANYQSGLLTSGLFASLEYRFGP